MSAHDEFPPADADVPPGPDEAFTERPQVDGLAPDRGTGPFIPAAIPAVARPPHPGFLGALLGSLLYLIFLIVVLASTFFVAVIVSAFSSPDWREYLDGLNAGEEGMAKLGALMGPAILAAYAASILVTWGVIRLVVGPDWRRSLALRRPSASHVALVLLAFPAFLLLPNLLQEWSRRLLPGWDTGDDFRTLFAHWPWWLGILAIGVGPGVGEELWCRGFLGRGLVGRYGVVAGVLLTSLFFGALHMYPPPYVLVTACMGLWLHFVYLTTRSLWLPILVHTLNNSLAFALTRLPEGHLLEETLRQSPVLVYSGSALLLAAVAVALYRGRARLEGPAPPYPSVAHPSPESDAVVVRPGAGWVSWLVVLAAAAAFVGSCTLAYLRAVNPGR